MVNFNSIAASLAVYSVISGVLAHPGEVKSAKEAKREIDMYKNAHEKAVRSLSKVADTPVAVALKARAAARRAATFERLRAERGLDNKSIFRKRSSADLAQYLAQSHDVSSLGYTLDTPLDVIFDSDSIAGLAPEVTIGPYFVSGEYIREDITEGLAGVPVHLDMQFVDINSYEPVSDLLIDIWHCSALGVYSGVSAGGQGGLNTTYLRGVAATDDDGVAQFDTIFPGHYQGRAHHIHILGTEDSTILANNTYVAGKTDHIGQIFFNQDLITEVESTSPYNTNSQQLTLTASDGIAGQQATSTHDPLVDYVLLGDDLSDGLLAFITIGIDTNADYSDNYTPAAHYQAGGGVDTGNGGGGPGGPGGPPK